MERNTPNYRRKRKRSPLGTLLGFLLICAIIFVGVSVFFRVSDIRVEGETRYTPAQVVEASGITLGNHIMLIDEAAVTERIQSELPYIGNASIVRRFPGRVDILVEEAEAIAYLATAYGYLLLDREGKVLEAQTVLPERNLITVTGLHPLERVVAGQALEVGEEHAYQIVYLEEILRNVYQIGIADRIGSLDMSDVLNPIFELSGRFTVQLGPNRNLSQKMQMLIEIYIRLDPHDRGVIDLNPDNPIFRAE